MARTSTILSDTLINSIAEYYLAGHSIREVSKYFNLTNRKLIVEVLANSGITIRSTKESCELRSLKIKANHMANKLARVDTIALAELICSLYTNNESLAEIWKQVKDKFAINLSDDEIKDILINNGVTLRTKADRYRLCVEKLQATNLKKYGATCTLANSDIRKKANDTIQKKYGDGITNPFAAKEIKEKIKQNNLEKYGFEYASQNGQIKEKTKQTLLAKYGVEHTLKCKYVYNNESFDSFPELCFYLFCINSGFDITRQISAFTYIYNNKKYNYFPDFKVNNELIEIKGDQFLTEADTWQNPFDHTKDALFEAKHQCALKNNVKILYEKDYQKYIDWFITNSYKKEDFMKGAEI